MRCLLLSLLLVVPLHAALGDALWQTLPPTPPPVAGEHTGHAKVNGISLYYATIGHGPPVVLLHGGLANSDYWGNQVTALAPRHTVILIDSRGHGRSTRDARPYGYDLMADDVVALLDTLAIGKADVVGWSDGGILGIDLAIRHPDRVGRIVAFAANTVTSGVQGWRREEPDLRTVHRARRPRIRAAVGDAEGLQGVRRADQQDVGDRAELDRRATEDDQSSVLVVDGDHDEAIKRDHTEYIAATIPGARLLIVPNTSHFAFLQDPTRFNAAMLQFLGDR